MVRNSPILSEDQKSPVESIDDHSMAVHTVIIYSIEIDR
jgi:hypothetical protein